MQISIKNAVIYPTSKKSNSIYVRITGYCKQCQKFDVKGGKYDISITDRPGNIDNEQEISEYAMVLVKSEEHAHESNEKNNIHLRRLHHRRRLHLLLRHLSVQATYHH